MSNSAALASVVRMQTTNLTCHTSGFRTILLASQINRRECQGSAAAGCVQAAALVACRQLGFAVGAGVFRGIDSLPANITLLPAWLSALPCTRLEETVMDCGRLAFGDTGICGLSLRLSCSDIAGSVPQTLVITIPVCAWRLPLLSDLQFMVIPHFC